MTETHSIPGAASANGYNILPISRISAFFGPVPENQEENPEEWRKFKDPFAALAFHSKVGELQNWFASPRITVVDPGVPEARADCRDPQSPYKYPVFKGDSATQWDYTSDDEETVKLRKIFDNVDGDPNGISTCSMLYSTCTGQLRIIRQESDRGESHFDMETAKGLAKALSNVYFEYYLPLAGTDDDVEYDDVEYAFDLGEWDMQARRKDSTSSQYVTEKVRVSLVCPQQQTFSCRLQRTSAPPAGTGAGD